MLGNCHKNWKGKKERYEILEEKIKEALETYRITHFIDIKMINEQIEELNSVYLKYMSDVTFPESLCDFEWNPELICDIIYSTMFAVFYAQEFLESFMRISKIMFLLIYPLFYLPIGILGLSIMILLFTVFPQCL